MHSKNTVLVIALMTLMTAWLLWPLEQRLADDSYREANSVGEAVLEDDGLTANIEPPNPFAKLKPGETKLVADKGEVRPVWEKVTNPAVRKAPQLSAQTGIPQERLVIRSSPVTIELEKSGSLSLNTEEFQSYLRVNLSSESLAHPLFEYYFSDSLDYIQAFPDWLTSLDSLPLTVSELSTISKHAKALEINEYNLMETQRLLTALQFEQARTSDDSADFQWRVDQYDDLLSQLSAEAGGAFMVQERLAEEIFTDQERVRALQYHHGLYMTSKNHGKP